MSYEDISKILISVDDDNKINITINDKPIDTIYDKEMVLYLNFLNNNIVIKNTKRAFLKSNNHFS